MARLLNDKATENPEFLVVTINALIFGKRMGQDDQTLSIGAFVLFAVSSYCKYFTN